MTAVFIASTEIIIDGMCKFQHDSHVQSHRWHKVMMNLNPNYQAEIAKMQADKRARGIGPEGRCPR